MLAGQISLLPERKSGWCLRKEAEVVLWLLHSWAHTHTPLTHTCTPPHTHMYLNAPKDLTTKRGLRL